MQWGLRALALGAAATADAEGTCTHDEAPAVENILAPIHVTNGITDADASKTDVVACFKECKVELGENIDFMSMKCEDIKCLRDNTKCKAASSLTCHEFTELCGACEALAAAAVAVTVMMRL